MRIGHASIDENNKAKGGKAGDQTGKEVCIREWYNKPWSLILRAKDPNVAERMAIACEKACKNDKIGYDQNQRNTLRTQCNLVGFNIDLIKTDCECDCSSLMTVCAEAAGIRVPYNGSNAPTTSTMQKAFMSTGYFYCYTDKTYTASPNKLKRGDILVKPGSHTAMALDDGNEAMKPETASKILNNYQFGIDVSENQKNINWKKVKESGVSYAILRATKRYNVPDATFKTNLQGCIDNKIDYSCYKFSYALTEEDARKEAKSVIDILNGKPMLIWLDMEWNKQITKKVNLEKIMMAFITECGLHGYSVGIYCNVNWYNNYIPKIIKDNYPFWIARYPSVDEGKFDIAKKPTVNHMVWQYSSKGHIDGISGNVDMDVMY